MEPSLIATYFAGKSISRQRRIPRSIKLQEKAYRRNDEKD